MKKNLCCHAGSVTQLELKIISTELNILAITFKFWYW